FHIPQSIAPRTTPPCNARSSAHRLIGSSLLNPRPRVRVWVYPRSIGSDPNPNPNPKIFIGQGLAPVGPDPNPTHIKSNSLWLSLQRSSSIVVAPLPVEVVNCSDRPPKPINVTLAVFLSSTTPLGVTIQARQRCG
ncbi:hypothetical protein Ddye_032135, partial [Dipteronia dyeriana]